MRGPHVSFRSAIAATLSWLKACKIEMKPFRTRMHHTPMQLAVPRSLWDGLQASFLAEGRKLCRDLAPILKIPEKELIQKLLTQPPKLQLAIVADEDRPLSCPVLLQKEKL